MSRKAIVVVSYGTSYIETREKTIGAIEKDIAAAFPDRDLRRAFTARMVIDIIRKREGIEVDFIEGALEKLANEGYEDVIVQPTHITNGGQYDHAADSVRKFKDRFKSIRMGTALLTTEADYDEVLETIRDEFYPKEKDTALVMMGHGTVHYANATYSQLHMKFQQCGMENAYITVVEGFPYFDDTLKMLRGKGYRKVVLVPLMVVAGDHATNDLAGDGPDSLKNLMKAEGYEVECIVKGLGENAAFRKLFVQHALKAGEL